MRRLAVLVALAALLPRPAAACFAFCSGPRWFSLEPRTQSPVPRDGALVFQGFSDGDMCLDELWPRIDIEVKRGGIAVPGRVELVGGANLLVFRPDKPWKAGATHHAKLTIDNAGLDAGGLPECDEPAVADVTFTVANDWSPPLPTPAAPVITPHTATIDDALTGVACCPGTTPGNDGTAGCSWEILWDTEGACAYLYETTVQLIGRAPEEAPELLRGQLLHQLLIDGEVVARDLDFDFVAVRNAPGCAVFEAVHLGTGETVRSPETCTPDEIAATLGVHLRDVAAELTCNEPVVCEVVDDAWQSGMCSPYDPASPPPPPASSYVDTTLTTTCPGLQGPGAGVHTSGCGCSHTESPNAALVFILLAALARRRRVEDRARLFARGSPTQSSVSCRVAGGHHPGPCFTSASFPASTSSS